MIYSDNLWVRLKLAQATYSTTCTETTIHIISYDYGMERRIWSQFQQKKKNYSRSKTTLRLRIEYETTRSRTRSTIDQRCKNELRPEVEIDYQRKQSPRVSRFINRSRCHTSASAVINYREVWLSSCERTNVTHWNSDLEHVLCDLPSSLEAFMKISALSETRNNGVNPIESNADLERAWVSSLSDEPIYDSMHITLSEEKLAS